MELTDCKKYKSDGAILPCIISVTLPKVRVDEHIIILDDIYIDYSKKPHTAKLFEIFIKDPQRYFTKKDLIEKIYKVENLEKKSLRYRESFSHNIIKLISRARKSMDYHCKIKGIPHIEWFPHHKQNQCWSFYSLSLPYIINRMPLEAI